jgi:uncharacterized iron-regulated membrane protein
MPAVEPAVPADEPRGPVAVADPRPDEEELAGWELDLTDPAPPARAVGRGGRGGGGGVASWGGLRPMLLRLHFYAGILVAPFLVIAALTGLLYALTPQLDAVLYGDQLHAAGRGGDLLPVDQQVAAARAAHPEGSIAAVQPAADPGSTIRVVLDIPGLPAEHERTVFVDPHTGAVRGTLTTWYGDTPTTTWIDSLHRTLHAGTVGRLYSETAASWLWVLTLGGLLLWFARRRRHRRHLLLADLTATGRRRTLGWHGPTGLWLALALLFLSATGLTWSHYAGGHFTALLNATHAHAPELDTTLTGPAPTRPAGPHAGHTTGGAGTSDGTGFDRIQSIARTAGLSGPLELTPPADATHAWSAAQIDNRWPVHLDQIAIDPTTGAITNTNRFGDYPLLAKLSKLGIQAHMGVLLGPANQAALAAIAIGLLCLIVWGYRMWWQRRPTTPAGHATRPVGPLPARGTWRRSNKPLLALLILATATIGWALPALGITLAAFVAIDLTRGAVHRRRSPIGAQAGGRSTAPSAAEGAEGADPEKTGREKRGLA